MNNKKWVKWVVLAACMFLAAAGCIIAGIMCLLGLISFGTPANTNGGHLPGTEFNFYAGPVLPLSASGDTGNLQTDREITFDFTGFGTGSTDGSAAVTDRYTLTNTSETDANVQLIYPFENSFSSGYTGAAAIPQIEADGIVMDTNIRIGRYSGGLTDDNMNLQDAGSWEEYKDILSDGSYLKNALSETSLSSQPVTVYFFENITLPEGNITDAGTIAMEFALDTAKSKVITYGLNGYSGDGSSNQYSFFTQEYGTGLRCLIVIGDPISDYELKGYSDGSCTNELAGLSCSVNIFESTLGDILTTCVEDFYSRNVENASSGEDIPGFCTVDNVSRAAYDFYLSYASGDDIAIRYSSWCRFDDIIQDAFSAGRVMYATCEVTIPAGTSINIVSKFTKAPSHNYIGFRTNAEASKGFDMAVTLGSPLTFRQQKAGIILPADVTITDQNFGFDIAAGITTVDLTGEYYHMEIAGKR
ncbi:MAG: hypothetical protein WCG21_05900 [Eubacteriales bacterium]